jgi:hypothetical protein
MSPSHNGAADRAQVGKQVLDALAAARPDGGTFAMAMVEMHRRPRQRDDRCRVAT